MEENHLMETEALSVWLLRRVNYQIFDNTFVWLGFCENGKALSKYLQFPSQSLCQIFIKAV